jgi:hypothetical protein
MNTHREVMQQALEALILADSRDGMYSYADEIAALRAALAEPAIKPDLTTEPVAWAMPRPDGLILDVICPDEHEAYEGEYTVPLYAEPQPKAEQEPGNWTVYNSGAEVASGLSFSEAWEYMTPERLARQWCAVCVLDKSNLPTAPQPKAWYGVSPMFGTVTFDSYQDALDAGFDNPLPLIAAAVWGEKT